MLRLQQAAQLLLQLLDGCVMPPDLPPVPSGEDAGDGLQRRTLRQLQQLALAQAEVDAGEGWRGACGWSLLAALLISMPCLPPPMAYISAWLCSGLSPAPMLSWWWHITLPR